MADTRTRYPITEDTWVKVIDGGTSATILKSVQDATYYCMLYNSSGDTPGVFPLDTQQKMFQGGNVDEFEYPSAAYLWVLAHGKDGAVVVTE